jgi:hypothetical protein
VPAVFNLALVTAPQANRVVFIAMYSLGTGVAGFVGGLLSGPLLLALQRFEGPAFGSTWTGFHSLFLISGSLRMLAWLWLRAVPEPARRASPKPRRRPGGRRGPLGRRGAERGAAAAGPARA